MASFLNAAGASVSGAGTPVIVVEGGRELSGATHAPLPDRIAAATYAAAVAAAGGQVTIENCRPDHFATFLQLLRATGCDVQQGQAHVTIVRDPARRLRGRQDLRTAAYPGFATDTAPLAAAVLLAADGPSYIYDALFENRFACAKGFAAMGARVGAKGRALWIGGGADLHGAEVEAPDLRGGAALVVAALAAQGRTTIHDPGYINRGYAALETTLSDLGASCIRRKKGV